MLFESFIGSAYESASPIADGEELINWYREKLESPGAPTRFALYPTPGFEILATAAVGPGRAHIFINDREFAVIATTLWEIDITGTVMTSRGSVSLDENPATISSNGDGGNQLFITSGGNGYNYDLTTDTLTQVSALNGLATMGDHLDGYFLVLDATTSTVYFSALLDGTSWTTGTDFFQRSAMPDRWKSMKVLPSRYILLLGEYTSEVWYDQGNATTPFALHQSGVIPHGIVAPFSVAIAGRDAVWLGTSRVGGVQVYRMAGFTPEAISSYPVQTAVGDYAVNEDALADTYQERGHLFYLLNFPTQEVTWAWDAETREWHKRGSWVSAENMFTVHRARWHAYAFGQHRWLDNITGNLYRMSSELYTDVDGESGIRRLRRAPALVDENRWVFHRKFELGVEVGVGLTDGQGSNPHIMLRMSNDGGKTWGAEMMRSLGKIGQYAKRVIWNRLGRARRRVYEVSVSDPIPTRLLEAYVETNVGDRMAAMAAQRGAGRGA